MKLASSLALIFGLASAAIAHHGSGSSIVVIPSTPSIGPIKAQYISSSNGLDGPENKLSQINSTSLGDIWYFDAVSPDGKYSFVASFWASPSPSYTTALQNDRILQAQMILLADDNIYAANSIFADTAEIITRGDGSSGDWKGTGCSFSGAEDLSTYTLNFASPFDIVGSIVLESRAPPHYKCSPAKAGMDMALLPHLGWANAIPDAKASVNLEVNGTHVEFTGIGYHDLSWGDVPLFGYCTTYLFGHGRLGPYSLVWVEIEASDGSKTTSGYVSEDGKILATSCSDVVIDPEYDSATGKQLQGFKITIDLGEKGVMDVELAVGKIIGDADDFITGTGQLSGGLQGGHKYQGSALFAAFSP